MKFDLRYYQEECRDAMLAGEADWSKQCAVLPVGSGKTIIFSSIAEAKVERREKTLILADRDALVEQACDKVYSSIGIEAGREQAKYGADKDNAIVAASVQTMVNRLDKWPRNHFSTLIIDEAHHCVADQWQRVLSHFDGGGTRVHGFTATPERNDRRSIGSYFENLSYEIGLRQLIHDGYLCPIKIMALPTRIDMNNVASVAGDFHAGQTHDTLLPLLRNIAEQVKEHCSDRKTVVFTPLVETARIFAEICKSIGMDADWVSGARSEKKTILKAFQKSKGGLLANASLLGEGWDCPPCSAIVSLRPSRSASLYSQQIGRGTRLHPSKEDLLVLDFLYLHERHSLIRPANILTGLDDVVQEMTDRAFRAGGAVDLLELEADAVEARQSRLEEELRRNRKRKMKLVDPIEMALAFGNLNAAQYEPTFAWEKEPVTAKQKEFLSKQKIDVDLIKTKGEASQYIGMMVPRMKQSLATPKQLLFLKRHKFRNPEQATFEQADRFIKAKKRQWNG